MSTKPAVKKAAKKSTKPEVNPNSSKLADFVRKHLSDRLPKMAKQPSAIANGGIDKIIKETCDGISDKTPNVKRVAVVTVLGKCGSRAKEADLAIK